VVILDNLGAHKGQKVKQLIESRAASVIFLPAYSPDFNPIEEAFSKIKAILKKTAARTREALIEAIGRTLEAVLSQDAWGWFAHCEYVDGDQPS
jgi:transposase